MPFSWENTRRRTCAQLLVVAAALLATQGFASQPNVREELALYARASSLKETLLETRAAYQQWLKEQQVPRAAVTLGVWYAMDLWRLTSAETQVNPQRPIDLARFTTPATFSRSWIGIASNVTAPNNQTATWISPER